MTEEAAARQILDGNHLFISPEPVPTFTPSYRNMADALAHEHCPADIEEYGKRHGLPEFVKMVWTAAFQAGWRACETHEDKEGTSPDMAEALKPFADTADEFDDDHDPDSVKIDDLGVRDITLGDCRAARAALRKAKGDAS